MQQRFLAGMVALVAFLSAAQADAARLRFANDGDVNSMDPYARQETFLLSMDGAMYEPLVGRDQNLQLIPMLATAWQQTSPTVWRFTIRQGVKFHDGTPFTADDVLFSYDRVRSPGSKLNSTLATVASIRKVDEETVEFVTNGPDPILPNEITNWYMMSKAWCEKNKTTASPDITKNEESFATRNENGTGPFILKDRQADVKTTLVKNPNWWGKSESNLDEIVFSVIKDPLTRVSALLSGEIDMIYTTPTESFDKIKATGGLKLLQTPELRTIFLGMDEYRDELLESSVKGKNPFKDIRVRRAFYQAIDEAAITQKVMRGYASPTALLVGKGINGFDEALNKRFPYDTVAAKKLLAEAGYPNGFEVELDCPNDRYVNDEQICQAIVAMLARVNIKVTLLAQNRAKHFAKIGEPGNTTSFYMLGWTPSTYDAHNALLNIVGTQNHDKGIGLNNSGRYSNPKLDTLITEIQVEIDKPKRDQLIAEALKIVKDDIAIIPLHQQTVVWAARANVDIKPTGDNFLQLRYVSVK
ncbi:MAG TPA: ABC transporter substrate-binding protein [Stellaceae bacterium]|nr:ABC transporter substrate-binding protein [Stellaceae bacterium]